MRQQTKNLKFRYAAIRRYGEKRFRAEAGVIEINPAYIVSIGSYDRAQLGDEVCRPYMIELSNGTSLLTLLRNYGGQPGELVATTEGEFANETVPEDMFRGVDIETVNADNKRISPVYKR